MSATNIDGPRAGAADRVRIGIEGLDAILGGGLPSHRLYLVEGEPGTGKTTIALQFLIEGLRNGEQGLYVTLSETRDELIATAESHGWSLEGIGRESSLHVIRTATRNT